MSYDAMILDMLAGGVTLTTPEIARNIGCPLRKAYARCRKLEQYGFLTSTRPGQGLAAPIFWRLARCSLIRRRGSTCIAYGGFCSIAISSPAVKVARSTGAVHKCWHILR